MSQGGLPLQLATATVVVGAVIGALYWLGHREEAIPLASAALDAPLAAQAVSSAAQPPGTQLPGAQPTTHAPVDLPHATARQLLPADAWAIVDAQGQLIGDSPFRGQLRGHCASVPAPERVGIALLPANTNEASLRVMLAAPRVSDGFWECAREAVVSVGGKVVGSSRGFEVLQSPSGLLVRSPERHLLFATHEDLLTHALALLKGAVPSAGNTGAHHELARNLESPKNSDAQTGGDPTATGESNSTLLFTAHLPTGWLDAAGPDAQRSPLRHLRAAALSARPDGSAIGALHCNEPGCKELGLFLERARMDLVTQLPKNLQQATRDSLDARLISGAPGGLGRISLSWASTNTPFSTLIGELVDQVTSGPARALLPGP